MTALGLPAIRALHAGITPGPYIVARYEHGGGRMFVEKASGRRELVIDTFGSEGNREFFAAAPSIVAQLLAVVEAQQAKLDAVTKIIDEKYHLWAAICAETCVKDVLGIDHDAIADAIANRIRAAIDGEDAA